MSQHQQTIAVPQHNASQLLALSYGAFQHLNWFDELATENRLIGCTKKTWQGAHDHIIVDAADENLTVTSKLPAGATWDIMGKNKRNVAKFLAAYEELKATATSEQMEAWGTALSALQAQSAVTIEKHKKEAAEAEAVMNLSSGSRTVTYGLIGLNVLVFVIMVASGVHLFTPKNADLIKWGADYKPLTTGGEWWRLLTSTFIHIGIIHIVMNMYALYVAGNYLEPMLGKGRFLAAYLCTGVLASLCSIWWHGSEFVSAGASGAIFGLYGVFLALLTTKLIPQSVRKGLLQSIGIFVVYNLVYGAGKQGIDNSAHLGGFISGFAVGYLYFLSFRKEAFRPVRAIGIVVVATVLLSFTFLRSTHQDGAAYNKKVDEVLQIQDTAMAPFKSYTSDSDLLSKLSQVSQVQWAKAKAIMEETDKYKLDEAMAKHRKLLEEYIDLRIRHTDLAIIALQGHEKVDAELDSLSKQINQKIAEMEKP